MSNKDPKNLGRCKILVPSVHGTSSTITPNLLPWARPISNIPVNGSIGSCCIPEEGDIVWVFFEGGNDDSPVYMGGSYGLNDIPISLDTVLLYENSGDKISYNKGSRSFSIISGDSHVIVSGGNIIIKSGNVNIESGTVSVKSGSVQLDSSVSVTGNLNLLGNLNISGSCNKECNCSHE